EIVGPDRLRLRHGIELLPRGRLPPGARLVAEGPRGVAVDGGRHVVPRSVALTARLPPAFAQVRMIRGGPAVDGHIDTATESDAVVDDENFLMMRCAHGMRPVDFEVQARVGEPIEHEHRRHSACEGTERTDVPLEQINIETGATFGEPFEEFTEFVRSLESCTL